MSAVEAAIQFEKHLRAALSLELPYSGQVHRDLGGSRKGKAIPAAVLLLFGYFRKRPSSSSSGLAEPLPALLYTLRTDEVETHKGQISFPGGHTEPEELNQPEITALRETEEEVGISRKSVILAGRLPPLFTATGYLIQPFVGILNRSIEEIPLVLDTKETAEAIWAPLESLSSPGIYQAQMYRVGDFDFPIDVYQYQHHRIWGATGSMTKNLLDRLNQGDGLI